MLACQRHGESPAHPDDHQPLRGSPVPPEQELAGRRSGTSEQTRSQRIIVHASSRSADS